MRRRRSMAAFAPCARRRGRHRMAARGQAGFRRLESTVLSAQDQPAGVAVTPPGTGAPRDRSMLASRVDGTHPPRRMDSSWVPIHERDSRAATTASRAPAWPSSTRRVKRLGTIARPRSAAAGRSPEEPTVQDPAPWGRCPSANRGIPAVHGPEGADERHDLMGCPHATGASRRGKPAGLRPGTGRPSAHRRGHPPAGRKAAPGTEATRARFSAGFLPSRGRRGTVSSSARRPWRHPAGR